MSEGMTFTDRVISYVEVELVSVTVKANPDSLPFCRTGVSELEDVDRKKCLTKACRSEQAVTCLLLFGMESGLHLFCHSS